MTYALVFAGGWLAVLGLVGVVRPATILGWIGGSTATGRWIFALGIRLALGAACLLAAPDCRHPQVVTALGWFALIAAAGVVLMGPRRLDTLVRWWLGMSTGWVVLSCACASVLGLFLAYTAW